MTTYCHISRQIADHAEQLGRHEARECAMEAEREYLGEHNAEELAALYPEIDSALWALAERITDGKAE